MRLLLTGASGFVGREVARRLHRAGHGLRILARSPNSPRVRQLAAAWEAQIYPGDVAQAASLEGALEGMEAVIHLVGIISEVGKSTFENVHWRGTANLVAAAQRAHVQRFIHMSALGTRPQAASRYHQTKWAAEQAVRESGLAFTIFRPSLIFGAEDQFANLFARISRLSPVLPILGRADARFQPVSVQDVAAAFAGSLQEPRAIGQTYDLCGSDTLTFSEILDQILAATGRHRLKLRIPLPLARAQAAALELVCSRLLRRPPPLNRDQLIMLQEDNVGNGQPARELFGLKGTGFSAGVKEMLGKHPAQTSMP